MLSEGRGQVAIICQFIIAAIQTSCRPVPVASKFWLVRPGSGCGMWLINLPVVT